MPRQEAQPRTEREWRIWLCERWTFVHTLKSLVKGEPSDHVLRYWQNRLAELTGRSSYPQESSDE